MATEGTSGNDDLVGTAGDDTLRGGLGNDRLTGGAGRDLLDGGDGFDAAIYDFSGSTTAIDFRSTFDTTAVSNLQADGLGGFDTLVGIEALEIYGGRVGDRIIGDRVQELIEGGGGADTLTGGGGNDTFAFNASATDLGVDRITDLQAGDSILLRNFAFTSVTAGEGTAITQGQIQIGAYNGTNNTTKVYVGTNATAGADLSIILVGNFQADHFSRGISGGNTTLTYTPPPDANETITGTGGHDYLVGGGGDDFISGGANNDTLEGGAGRDTLSGGAGNDRLYGGDGTDFVYGSGGRDMLYGGAGDDLVDATNMKDGNFEDCMLWGDAGNDMLWGAGGNDRLTGGDGNDVLIGAGGNDTLIGNAGADRFRFSGGPTGDDTIEWFRVSHGDIIEIAQGHNNAIYSESDAMARLTQVGSDAVLDMGGGDSLTLVGVSVGQLGAGSFYVYSMSQPLPPDPPWY